jgi:nitrate/nitrite transporter NarK
MKQQIEVFVFEMASTTRIWHLYYGDFNRVCKGLSGGSFYLGINTVTNFFLKEKQTL